MKNIRIAGVLACTLLMASCGKDFLEVFPNDQLVTETAITGVDGANAALYGAYNTMQSVNSYNCNMITFGEVRGGDMQTFARGSRTNNYYVFNNRTPDNVDENLWAVPYTALNQVNNVIAAFIDGNITDGTKEERDNILGQCYTLRAFFHFDIVKLFGVPYMKDKTAPGAVIADRVIPASEKPQRSTVEQTYTFIREDLTQAIQLLATSKAIDNGYINYWAAQALLSRVALYMGDWDAAFSAAKTVIADGPYVLVPNGSYVTSWAQEFTTESIFDVVNTASDNGDRESIGYVADPAGYGAMIATTAFVNLLQEDPDDVRLKLLKNDNSGQLGYIAKYPGRGMSMINNVRILRLSEIYLNAAEAALRKASKDQTAADDYLYAIQRRANPAAVKITATTDNVLTERRKELVSEGHRFFDVMRLGITVNRTGGRNYLNQDEVTTVTWDDFRCVLPIPRYEINVNPTILPTPGYSNN